MTRDTNTQSGVAARLIRAAALVLIGAALPVPGHAQDAPGPLRPESGGVRLEGALIIGLARDGSFTLREGPWPTVMVCNLDDPQDYISVRTGPGEEHAIARSLNRFAVVVVDASQRQGNWVRVLGAGRTEDVHGDTVDPVDLPVTGWAHDGYLCDFL